MDEEKRRKRNKKKKSKQSGRAAEGGGAAAVAAGDGETVAVEERSRLSNGGAHGNEEESGAGQDDAEVADQVEPLPNGAEDHVDIQSSLGGAVEQNRLEIKASLEENIKHLRNENDLHKEKEAVLATNLAQLESEKAIWLQKEVSFKEKIGQLSDEKAKLSDEKAILELKQASFKEKISQILDEKANLELKQESLEEKIRQLERDHDSWVSKEEHLVEKIQELERDHDSWVLKEVSLEEKIRQLEKDHESWLLKEVSKLEESKIGYLQENRRLKDNVLELQGQIHLLENASSVNHSDEKRKRFSEYEELNSQMEAACALVEKLIADNADLVEKVNQLYLQLDQQKAAPGLTSPFQSGSTVEIAESTSIVDRSSASNADILVLDERPESSKDIQMHDDITSEDKINGEQSLLISSSAKPEDTGEIVQIPLDDNEVQDLESQAFESEEKNVVPLSDAPLIGAPLRLISFFASYVSGADLVDKDVKSSH
ncbi:intracellular protein transport protein USO1 isoform X2 [Eucalyptus grandis]|uniref:intracellular protein transport protein USO1 isoform X2 n=1 Tax=Eucalyptus grandis TaxID=71139 RepID=UPI00192EA1E2|nr:intracellular protein transport protein USO1 isoform X2 [Eucalyptus grandis]